MSTELGEVQVIDDVVIEVILHILDSWKGKLTWDALILEIKANIATTYTRQALSNHERISSAFVLRKMSLAKEQGRTSSGDSRLDSMMETVSSLKAENIRLHAECERYRAQFIRWVYNSQRKNLTFEQLDAPMPPVHRGRSSE